MAFPNFFSMKPALATQSLWVTSKTHFALNRLANRYGVTQREILERLVYEDDDAILKTIDPEWDVYMGVTA